MLDAEDLFPTLNIRVITDRLILRMPTFAEAISLSNLAAAGIHEPGARPFRIEWTNGTPLEVARRVAQRAMLHLGEAFDGTACDDIELAVFLKTRPITPVGRVGLQIHDRPIRAGKTHSWIGRAYQGNGYGTEARLAMMAFMFDGLGLLRASTRAFEDNEASLRVTQKIPGYKHTDTVPNDDGRRDTLVFEMTVDDWHEHTRLSVELHGMGIARDYLGLD